MAAGLSRDLAGSTLAWRSLGATLAFALAAAVPVAADERMVPVPLESLSGRIRSNGPFSLGARGLETEVDGWRNLSLPLAAQELELDVEADGPVLLTWAMRNGIRVRQRGPPWRYVTLPRPAGTVRLDLRQAADWTPSSQAVLTLDGSGRVAIRALRVRPVPADPAAAGDALDRALLRAPESMGHTTINCLTPAYWSATRGIWLADVVAGLALAVGIAVLALERLRRGRWRPRVALAAAAVAAIGAWDVHFLVRFLPMASLKVPGSAEARIRDGYAFAPELGELAELARRTLRADERVGAMAEEKDWFAPQTLCFNLAPRRCAIVRQGAREHAGIQGIERLREDEIDAIVSFRGEPLPEGFVPVAAVSARALVARRR